MAQSEWKHFELLHQFAYCTNDRVTFHNDLLIIMARATPTMCVYNKATKNALKNKDVGI